MSCRRSFFCPQSDDYFHDSVCNYDYWIKLLVYEMATSRPPIYGNDETATSKPAIPGNDEMVTSRPPIPGNDEMVTSRPPIPGNDEVIKVGEFQMGFQDVAFLLS